MHLASPPRPTYIDIPGHSAAGVEPHDSGGNADHHDNHKWCFDNSSYRAYTCEQKGRLERKGRHERKGGRERGGGG